MKTCPIIYAVLILLVSGLYLPVSAVGFDHSNFDQVLKPITPSKVKGFAFEAQILDTSEIKDMPDLYIRIHS